MLHLRRTARDEFQGPMFDLVEYYATTPSSPNDTKIKSRSIDERHLDIEWTFSPRPRPIYLTAKIFILAWTIAITFHSISGATHKVFWLAYLTHWGVMFTVAYMLMSVSSAIYLAVRPPKTNTTVLEGRTGLLLKMTWALFAISLPAEVVITILFWVLEFNGSLTYVSVMVHGGFAILLLLDGLLLSRIPLRAKQFFLSQALCLTYICWGLVHAYVGNIGNPYKEDGTQDDDAIYASIAWMNNPKVTSIVVVGIFFLVNPAVFFMCRAVSRLIPRRFCDEEEKKRTFKGGEQQQLSNDEESHG
eukprot:CAMPEP_0181082538 /NCGR_PEP_ID=MMETSP1071-20121207/3674_1 /TAXON_ID=35127 /ORGANISM="Thalassiosira sp., Strain NH16" /LENGTH=302 /DNA_ID=CAMNT_0023164129 /DNA_START=226 /DNA_END=1134 /DNA_ORIENTATION=-